MLGTWPVLEEEKQLVYWIRQEASKGAKFSRMSGRQIKELYYKRRGAAVLLNRDEKSAGKNGRQKTNTVFVERARKVGVFQRLRSHDAEWDCRVRSTSSCSLAGIIDS
nr:ASN_HP1_G0004720.mRNA.1.CDS.1 [Saccharomyces cerevisiae]